MCSGLAKFSDQTLEKLQNMGNLFPVEVDLSPSAFQYKANSAINQVLWINWLEHNI